MASWSHKATRQEEGTYAKDVGKELWYCSLKMEEDNEAGLGGRLELPKDQGTFTSHRRLSGRGRIAERHLNTALIRAGEIA